MRRLGLFIFYDPHGHVDDYVGYLLAELRSVCTELISVCNCTPDEAGMTLLRTYSARVICRENHGMDAGAIREFLLSERTYVESFDELVWCNDTVYGPIYPLKDVFDEMQQRGSLDFWGITAHARSNASWTGRSKPGIPEHLQSYFIVIGNAPLHDEHFYRYWQDMHVSDDFHRTVAGYELSLTPTLTGWGYRYGVYCDTISRDNDPDCVCNLTADAVYQLITEYHCPFLKRKAFIRPRAEAMLHCSGEQMQRAMDHVRKNTDYDTSLIFQNLCRLYDQRLWSATLGSNRVLSARSAPNDTCSEQMLIVAELDDEISVHELHSYIDSLPEWCTLYVVTHDVALRSIITKTLHPRQLTALSPQKRGLGSLIAAMPEAPKQDYICILQASDMPAINALQLRRSSDRYLTYRSLIGSESMLRNIRRTFAEECCLGVLMKPDFPPIRPTDTGFANMQDVRTTATAFGDIVPDTRATDSPLHAKSLWLRRELLDRLLKHRALLSNVKDGVLERSIYYIAQSNGYYTANVTDESGVALLLEDHSNAVSDCALRMREYEVLFQRLAAWNSGSRSTEYPELTYRELMRLLRATVLYHCKKKLHLPIRPEQRSAFFLGVRDVLKAFPMMRNKNK